MNWLALILRWLHIVAAISLVGGTVFMRLALIPSVAALTDEQRGAMHQQVRSRWARIVHASIAFLLLSGIWNYVRFLNESKAWGDDWRTAYYNSYQVLFGIKFLIALAIFFLASVLSGRSDGTKKFRQNAKLWTGVNLALALVVVALSAGMRMTHVGPTGIELTKPIATAEVVSK